MIDGGRQGKDQLNITRVVRDGLCTGCGICAAICPQQVIDVVERDGRLIPLVDASGCTADQGCSQCVKVCGGHEINIAAAAERLFPSAAPHPMLGSVLSCWSGWSNDHEIRLNGASGGMVTGLLIHLLERGEIDGALVVGWQEGRPLRPEAFIARTRKELAAARSSKYCPTSIGQAVRLIGKNERIVVVGLPCQIHSLRKLTLANRRTARQIVGCFGIYCSSMKSYPATEYILGRHGVRAEDVRWFSYREGGCPGSLRAEHRGGTLRVPYRSYYHPIRSFFILPRCVTCCDQTAELADLSFGDIQTGAFRDDDVGVNSVITRSAAWEDRLRKVAADGALTLDPVDPETVRRSQATMLRNKKEKIGGRLALRRKLGLKNPAYGGERFPVTMTGLLSGLVTYGEIALGRRRELWPLIGILDRLARRSRG